MADPRLADLLRPALRRAFDAGLRAGRDTPSPPAGDPGGAAQPPADNLAALHLLAAALAAKAEGDDDAAEKVLDLAGDPEGAAELVGDLDGGTHGMTAVRPAGGADPDAARQVRELFAAVSRALAGPTQNYAGPPRPGLVPQTGDADHPGHWVRPEEAERDDHAAAGHGADAGTVARVKAAAGRVRDAVHGWMVRATPAAWELLNAVVDTPEDWKKFGYEPTFAAPAHGSADPVRQQFGVGSHLALSIVSKALVRALTWAKSRGKVGARTYSADGPQVHAPHPNVSGAVHWLPADTLHADPDRFQWRDADAHAEQVTDLPPYPLDPEHLAPLAVWRDPDDRKTYVVDGHKRHAWATRDGTEHLPCRYVFAPDAETAKEVGKELNALKFRRPEKPRAYAAEAAVGLLKKIVAAVKEHTPDELSGLRVYVHPGNRWVWVDQMDWHDGKAGKAVIEAAEGATGAEAEEGHRHKDGPPKGPGVFVFNEGPNPPGDGWVDATDEAESRAYSAGVGGKPTAAVDLDGTLASYDGWKGSDHFGGPRPGAADFLRDLSRTHRVLIFTTRTKDDDPALLRTGNAQNRHALASLVRGWLDQNGLPYDDVYIGQGKPIADVYVDDRAVPVPTNPGPADYRAALSAIRGRPKSYAADYDPAAVRVYAWVADPTPRSKSRATNTSSGEHAYGERARRLLAAQGRSDRGEPEPEHPARARARQYREEREPAREEARQRWAAAVADPASLTLDHVEGLRDHLHALTRDEARSILKELGKRAGGRLKAEIVDGLLNHLRASGVNARVDAAVPGSRVEARERAPEPAAGQGDGPRREQSQEEAAVGAGDDFRFPAARGRSRHRDTLAPAPSGAPRPGAGTPQATPPAPEAGRPAPEAGRPTGQPAEPAAGQAPAEPGPAAAPAPEPAKAAPPPANTPPTTPPEEPAMADLTPPPPAGEPPSPPATPAGGTPRPTPGGRPARRRPAWAADVAGVLDAYDGATGRGREVVENALANTGYLDTDANGDPTGYARAAPEGDEYGRDGPAAARASLAQQLASGYRDAYATGDAGPAAAALESLGAGPVGGPGEPATFDGSRMEHAPGLFTGHPVRVVRPGWESPDGRVLLKAVVEPAGAARPAPPASPPPPAAPAAPAKPAAAPAAGHAERLRDALARAGRDAHAVTPAEADDLLAPVRAMRARDAVALARGLGLSGVASKEQAVARLRGRLVGAAETLGSQQV